MWQEYVRILFKRVLYSSRILNKSCNMYTFRSMIILIYFSYILITKIRGYITSECITLIFNMTANYLRWYTETEMPLAKYVVFTYKKRLCDYHRYSFIRVFNQGGPCNKLYWRTNTKFILNINFIFKYGNRIYINTLELPNDKLSCVKS